MKKQILILMFFSVMFILSLQNLYAFENKATHPALTDRAVSTSIIDNYLKTQLGLENGITTELEWDFPSNIEHRLGRGLAEPGNTTRTALDWIKAGSVIEDVPLTNRPPNHFHDPYRNAGLDNTENANFVRYLFYQGDSAKEWAIDHSSNEFDWQSARSDFYSALTANSQSDRNAYAADFTVLR